MDTEKRDRVRKSLRDGAWHTNSEVSEITGISATGLTGITRHDDKIERRKDGSVEYRFNGTIPVNSLIWDEMNEKERLDYFHNLGLGNGKIVRVEKSASNKVKGV